MTSQLSLDSVKGFAKRLAFQRHERFARSFEAVRQVNRTPAIRMIGLAVEALIYHRQRRWNKHHDRSAALWHFDIRARCRARTREYWNDDADERGKFAEALYQARFVLTPIPS